ncbi:siphovirus ReqiPepy6 Gp37-like family protein [Streptomyces sp. UH6]|uniref:siphovirus ReqiPepy6 Gp37-like family protein n=1 Tax=Streptomyces sp. UH6 TaxID=2748379 RepID=UPI0015D490F5|nr:siphovirus ReqiPepy6 Gp37-like family protein [Streptomyces sp. UH6]NYV72992.1 siphovirus ReqiPepy6 Gp37-like family protein [Streptomyces sp. UH6]
MSLPTFLVTDRNLQALGALHGWTETEVTLNFNAPASGSLTIPARPEVMALLQPGHRVVMIRDKQVWSAGPLEVPVDYDWSADQNPGDGTVTVHWSDDLAVVAGRITWPVPGSGWTSQLGFTWRQINATNAETIIRTLVNENAGPGALTVRRVPGLVLGSVAGVGTSTTVRTRFEALLDVCRNVAAAGGGLGFRTRQVGAQILFEVYQPADLTDTARFSKGLGNLRSLSLQTGAPRATHALVAGTETEGSTSRTFVERADTAAAATWWRVEQYLDGGAPNNLQGELAAAGDAELAETAEQVELSTTTVDTPTLRAGVDYGLGDRVTVALPHGIEVADVVRAIHLTATPETGELVTAVIGAQGATSDPQTVRVLRDLTRRLGRLETRR